MTQLYLHSQHHTFKQASSEAKAISAKHQFSAVVRRSKTSDGAWDVLVPWPIEPLDEEFDDELLEEEENRRYEMALGSLIYEEELRQAEQDWIADLERREIQQDIHSDQDDWGRLEEEGWFYED